MKDGYLKQNLKSLGDTEARLLSSLSSKGKGVFTLADVTIGIEQMVLRWISILAVTMAVGLTAVMIIACGSSDTPSRVVEKFYKYTQENNCQEVPDLVIDRRPEVVDSYVNSCERFADKLVSYSIKGETIDATPLGKNSAVVDTEVTLREDNGEETNSAPQYLVKRGDDWKLTHMESRS